MTQPFVTCSLMMRPSRLTLHAVIETSMSVSDLPRAKSEGASSRRSRLVALALMPGQGTWTLGMAQYDVKLVLHVPAVPLVALVVYLATIALNASDTFWIAPSMGGKGGCDGGGGSPSCCASCCCCCGHPSASGPSRRTASAAHAATSSLVSGEPSRVRTCAVIWIGSGSNHFAISSRAMPAGESGGGATPTSSSFEKLGYMSRPPKLMTMTTVEMITRTIADERQS